MSLKRLLFLLIIFSALILNLLPYFVDGRMGCLEKNCGFIFGTNYRDGLWFFAVANTAFNKIPFIHPTFAGENLSGYHFLPNFLVFFLSKIGISPFFSYFKLIPFFYFLTITFILFKILITIKNDFTFLNLGFFFFCFGIPFTLLTSLINNQPLNNGLLINTFQATRVLESPHTAIGLIIIFLVYYWLLKNKLDEKWPVILFLFFICFGIKFYAAVTLGMLIGFYLLLNREKNYIKKLISLIVVGGIAVLIFLQPDFKKPPTFIFSPFSTVHHLIESPNLFYNKNLILARYFLYEKGMGPRLLAIELYSLFLFVFFYLGTRFFGVFYFFLKKKIKPLDKSVFLTFIACVFLSTFFIQRGDWFNPIQFLVPSAYLFALYTALFFHNLFKNNKFIFITIFTPIFIFTFLPNLVNLTYLKNQARLVIDKEEIEALNYLKKMPFNYVFAPIDENDTSYVAAFSQKPTYLNFLTINQTLGINYQKRLKKIGDPQNFNPENVEVKYFYLPKQNPYTQKIIDKLTSKKYQKIFENKKVIIFLKK